MLREKLIVVNTHIKNEEIPQMNNLNLHIKGLEKIIAKTSRRNKIRAYIHKIENKKQERKKETKPATSSLKNIIKMTFS